MSNLSNITSDQAVVGAVISKLREVKKPPLLQQELAQMMDVSPSAWSRVEKGETALSAEQLRLLTQSLGISADSFFSLVDEAKAGLEGNGVKVSATSIFKAAFKNGLAGRMAMGAGVGMFVPVIGPVLGALTGAVLATQLDKFRSSFGKDSK